MRPANVQPIGSELAIKWDDGTETYIAFEKLRRSCPCAGCRGEKDIMGNVYKNPEKPLGPESFQLTSISKIGAYALQPTWGDGHNSGLFSFDYLKKIEMGEDQEAV